MRKFTQLIFLVFIMHTLNAETNFLEEIKNPKDTKVDNALTSASSFAPFITIWETTTANETIKVPMHGDYDIDWGDGITESVTGTAEHIYTIADTYTISITGGATKISFNLVSHSKTKIKKIAQWGDIAWGADLSYAFYSCTNLNIIATDTPDLSSTTNLSYMFNGASSMNADLSSWDVSTITNMSYFFSGAHSFNGDLSSWNVSNVTSMSHMFSDAHAFDQNISSWNVGNVTTMRFMFSEAHAFDQNISSWNISSLIDNFSMFYNVGLSTTNYNNILIGWASLDTVPYNLYLGILFLKHCTGANAKAILESKGWTIIDEGLECNIWTGATDVNWETTTNWSAGVLPTALFKVIIPHTSNNPIIGASTIALSQDLTLETGATLTLATGGSLTVNGSLFSADTKAITVNSGSSIIVKGSTNNTITFHRNLPTTNWYLISSPVIGETIEGLTTSNNIATGSTNLGITNIGLAPYDNTKVSSKWVYQNTASTGTIAEGKGYSVKLATAGNLSFSGTILTETKAITLSQATNNFNLVGNPFSAYLNLGDFFLDNASVGVLSENTAWFWNQNLGTYESKTSSIDGTFEIAPTQGFFLSAGSAFTTAIFDITDITHQSTDFFQRQSDERPQIKLFIKEGTNNRNTRIFYIEGTTTGFDNGYDGTIFGGAANSFQVYTQLVADSNGEKLSVQALPNSGYESMVIPLGLNTTEGKEITFSAETLNLPVGISLILEDKDTNIFTRLDKAGSKYSFTPKEILNGIGRFYLHTPRSTLNIQSNLAEIPISVYQTSTSMLRITGLLEGKSTIKIFTLLGTKIVSKSFETNGNHLEKLPNIVSGIYIIQIKNRTRQLTRKIILE